MEINFQTQQNSSRNENLYHFQTPITPPTTPKSQTKPKPKSKKTNPTKFLGVRQRPSGRWVAEIKDTTQKIRMWLGTFETAEEAARAYDEAACLLRGSNTRTNFSTQQLSPNSPIASRIRAQLKHKKLKNLESNSNHSTPKIPSSSVQNFSISSSADVDSPSFSVTSNMVTNPFEIIPTGNFNTAPIGCDNYQNTTLLDEEVYKPCFANGGDELGQFELTPLLMDQSLMYEPAAFDRFGFEVPESSVSNSSFSEFDRVKLQEYFDKLLFDQCDNTLLDYQSQICHLSCRT